MSEFPYPYDKPLPSIKFPSPKRQLALTPGVLGIVLAVIALCFVLSNVTIFPVSRNMDPVSVGEFWTAFCTGLVGAEAGLLVIAAVLAPGNGLLRHVIVVPLAMIWILAWFLGYKLYWWTQGTYFSYPEWKEVFSSILVIPLMFCACELPLWIFRTLLRWRITPSGQKDSRRTPPNLSIAGILMATGAVALALASVRSGRRLVSNDMSEADWWGASGIAVAFSGGISLLTLPLSVWATLRCSSLVAGLGATIAWLMGAALLLVCCVSALADNWPFMELEFWFLFFGMNCGFAVGLLGTLSLVRAGGYRLLWGREETQISVSTLAAPSEVPPAPQQ